jgi:hypothetical protein
MNCVVMCSGSCMVLMYVAIVLALPITSIVLGVKKPGNCTDVVDPSGIDVGTYLIVHGSIHIVTGIPLLFVAVCIAVGSMEGAAVTSIIFLLFCLIRTIFIFVWFIIGAIVLYRSNIKCINNGAPYAVYAVVMWVLDACTIIQECNTNKQNYNERDN